MSSTKKTTAALPDPASPKQKNLDRGRKNVEARLIKATCELLSRKGPRAVSIRDIAERAGVNHGQIHHYFGGKKGLISTAVRHMSQEHAEHVADRGLTKLDGPPPLTLGKDKTYVMSIIRLILDGELDLATQELEDEISIPRHMLEELTKSRGYRKPTTEIKSTVAAVMAIELAWAALEPYILRVTGTRPNEEEKVRRGVATIATELIEQLEPKSKS